MPFSPRFKITSKLAASLMRIEAAKQSVQDLPITEGNIKALHAFVMAEGRKKVAATPYRDG